MNRKAIVAVLISILVLGTVIVGAEANQNGSSNNLIHAAYNRTTGMLRIITEGAEPRENEESIFWNATGPQGEPGPQGPVGPPGPVGDIDGLEQLVAEMVAEEVADLQARVKVLETQLGIIPPDGGAFVSFEEINTVPMDYFCTSSNDYFNHDYETVNVTIDKDLGKVLIMPKINEGSVSIYVEDSFKWLQVTGLAAIDVTVVDGEVIVTNIIPWAERSARAVNPYAFHHDFGDHDTFSTITNENPDIVRLIKRYTNYYYIFAIREGTATIHATTLDGKEATELYTVDQNRRLLF